MATSSRSRTELPVADDPGMTTKYVTIPVLDREHNVRLGESLLVHAVRCFVVSFWP